MKAAAPIAIALLSAILAAAPADARPSSSRQDVPGQVKKWKKEWKGVPWDRAEPVESEHYIVTSSASEEVAAEYSRLLEAAYAALSDIFGGLGKPSAEKSDVYIVRNYDDFLNLTGRRHIHGFYTPLGSPVIPARTIVTYHGVHQGIAMDTKTILLHHAAQNFLHRLEGAGFSNLPHWLVDGVGVLFESSWIREGKVVYREGGGPRIGIVPREDLHRLQGAIRGERGGRVPLKRLHRASSEVYAANHSAHAWSLVHWMINAEDGKYRPIFDGLLKMAGKKEVTAEDVEAAIKGATGLDIDAFEEKVWKPYVLALRLPSAGDIIEGKFTSRRANMEIGRPGEDWRWVLDDLPAELQVRLENAEAGATIEVAARMSGVTWIDLVEEGMNAIYADAVGKKLDSIGTEAGGKEDPDLEELTVAGYKAARLSYTVAASDAGKARLAKVVVLVPTVERTYEIRLTCPAENAEEVEPALAETVKSFKVLP